MRISDESASSDTARASAIAPTSALKVKIALDLAARLSSPGSNPISNSRSFLTCSEVKRTSPLVATSDFRGQCAEGAARTWIPAVHIAHIVVDKLLEG